MKTRDGRKRIQTFGARRPSVDRREFLAAATGLASAALFTEKGASAAAKTLSAGAEPARPAPGKALALEGGKPVRSTPLDANFPGPLYYDEEEQRELLDVLKRRAPFRWYGIGPKGGAPHQCNDFEKEFAARQRARYCVAVTSGTMALYTAMAALGAGPGDEVILPAWTWYSCYNAIVAAGATPVFAEIDDSFNLDPADLERHINPQTKVIMAVHIAGEPADMDAIQATARKHGAKVLEDCAQSMGASHKGRPVGSIGDCGIYSFQVCKTLSPGEGGAVVTSDPEVFERAARFHDLGNLRAGHAQMLGQAPHLAQFLGGQFRMSEFTGAVMRAQLRKLDRIVADFRVRAERVTTGIRDLPGIHLRTSHDPQGAVPSWVYLRTSSRAQRDRFIAALQAENIPASPMEGSAILPIAPYIEQKQAPALAAGWPSFATPHGRALKFGAACCPRTIEMRDRYVGVPMDPTYSDQDVADIIAAIRKVYPAVAQA